MHDGFRGCISFLRGTAVADVCERSGEHPYLHGKFELILPKTFLPIGDAGREKPQHYVFLWLYRTAPHVSKQPEGHFMWILAGAA